MDRDTGFRSWFQRAIQLSPSLRQIDNSENDDSVDGDDHFDRIVEGARAKTSGGRGSLSSEISHWSLLLKDNVRFWDCLAMLRTDPGLSCHSAIYLVTQSPDSEYFPEELRSINSSYFKDEEELQTEILRLMVENRKLHAVLWVLSDNSHFRVDSVVAAIFRLNEIQFEEKFHFVYQPGCFSGMSPVLGPGTKAADKGGASIALHTKRCRSSTPVRTCRPLRHVSDRLYHSVTRSSTYRRGKNISSNKSKCPIHKFEPPRKRRSDWMKSALLTGLDNKSTNNILSKRLENDDYAEDDESVDGLDENFDMDNDIDDTSGNDDGFNFESYFTTNESTQKRPDHSQSRWDLARRKPISIIKGSCSLNSYNDKAPWNTSKYYSNNNNNTFLDYIDKRLGENSSISVSKTRASRSVIENSILKTGMSISINDTYDHLKKKTGSRKSSISNPLLKTTSRTVSERCSILKNNVTFQKTPSIASKTGTFITYSDSPNQDYTRFLPYSLSEYDKPADFIRRQNQNQNMVNDSHHRTDIKFCPNLKRNKTSKSISPNSKSKKILLDDALQGNRNDDEVKDGESLIKFNFKKVLHRKHPSEDSITSRAVSYVENNIAADDSKICTATPVTQSEESALQLKSDEANSCDEKKTASSNNEMQNSTIAGQRPMPLWNTPKDRCVCLKETLSKMGRRRYTKPLAAMINESCSGDNT